MKKFIIIVLCIALLFVGVDAAYYRLGVYIDLNPSKEVKTFVKTKENKIYSVLVQQARIVHTKARINYS